MSASWKGSLSFGGFPVSVALNQRVRSRSADSFKTLAPNGQPIKQVYIDTDGEIVDRKATSKGLERAKDDYIPLSEAQVERIEAGQRSTLVEPMQFAPLDTIPFDLAQSDYQVVPDAKVPGSERSVNVLWNGLLDMGVAYVTQITMRTRDSILAVWANEDGLWATSLPFTTELNALPAPDLSENEGEASMFKAVVEGSYEVASFDHATFISDYATKRLQIIDEALSGAPEAKTVESAPQAGTVDMMAALAAIAEAKPAKAKRKKATAKA